MEHAVTAAPSWILIAAVYVTNFPLSFVWIESKGWKFEEPTPQWANPKVSAAPRVGIRARLGKPFAQRGEASNGAVQTKSLETIYKQALSSGKLNMSNRNMVHVPLQDFLNVASSGVDGVNFWEVIDLKHIDLSHNSISQ